jgi:hypothetical protein
MGGAGREEEGEPKADEEQGQPEAGPEQAESWTGPEFRALPTTCGPAARHDVPLCMMGEPMDQHTPKIRPGTSSGRGGVPWV